MEMKRNLLLLIGLCMAVCVQAQKKNFSYKFYGQVRGDLFYNSRANAEIVDGLFHLYPKDVALDADGKDLNASPNGSFYLLYSRLGIDVQGPKVGSAKTSLKLEADFRGSGSNWAVLRIRHAYVNLDWENTASARGSRVDGFNPEYGAPTLPTVEILREMMDEKDLWPINKAVWDYLDGNGFHLMSTMYADLVNNYGQSSSIDEFAQKGQFVGAMNSKSIWEVWNYNKLDYGDRFCSGLLFWYHNCPVRQVCARMWDWSLEPTASLYHTANALEPLHVQFDYLKNTVSVVNDYYQEFEGYTVVAQVYDINSKKAENIGVQC